MFDLFKKKNTCCDSKNGESVDYKALSETLKNQVENLQSRLNTAFSETADSPFAFDFKTVKAFSIERNWHNDRPCAIIGYILNEPYTETENGVQYKEVVREWYLYCSKERHVELVEQFRKAMKG